MVCLHLGYYYLLMTVHFQNEFSINIHCLYYILLPNYDAKSPRFIQVAATQNAVAEMVSIHKKRSRAILRESNWAEEMTVRRIIRIEGSMA